MEDPVSIGPWRVLGRLGAGGMGVVYRARHRYSDELAAVKTIKATDPSVARMLRREVRALARLRHPGVVRILEAGETGGVPWYAMSLVDGPTLADVRLSARKPDLGDAPTLKRSDTPTRPEPDVAQEATADPAAQSAVDVDAMTAPADPARVARVYARLAASLAWMHGEGVVHQDLKPSNVVLKDGDMPVLVDFGLAGAFVGADSREALDLGAFGGTVAYLSPEHIRGEPIDARGDIYALGVMMFRALTGRAPFVGTAKDVAWAHVHRAPPHPTTLAADVPEGLCQLVLALLAKDPRDRIGHAGMVAERLAEWAGPDAIPGDWPSARPYLYRPAVAGRDDVRQWLEEQRRSGRVALIGGASGLGKTRLLVELGRRATSDGHVVLTGRALPPNDPGAGALHPLRGPLEQLAERFRSTPERIFGDRGAVLAPYAPGVPSEGPAPQLPPAQARKQLIDAVAETLKAAARTKPMLVLLDDLHDADALTVEVLARLAGEPRTEPLLVVGTWRSDRPGAAINAMLGRNGVARKRLGPLDATALAALAGDMLAERRVSDRLLQFLVAHGEGNPLFVSEYLRAALDRGMLARDATGRWGLAEAARPDELGLPRTIDGLLAQRLDALAPDLRALAEVAAVLGRDVDGALLAAAASLSEEAALDAVQALTDRQVLADGPRFAHPSLRDRLYERLAPERRVALHRAAWEALPQEPGTLAARAHHAEQAGDRDTAAALWLDAGRYALRRYDHPGAEAALRACIALGAPRIALDARFHLGFDVLSPLGRLDEAIAVTEEELAQARALGFEAQETRAMRSLAAFRNERGLWEEGARAFAEALDLDRARGNLRGVAFGAYNLAQAQRGLHRPADALPLLHEALEASRAAGGALREGNIIGAIAGCLHELGRVDEAEPMYLEAIPAAVAAGEHTIGATTRGNLANLYADADRLEEAEAQYTAATAMHRKAGYAAGEAHVLLNHARLRLSLGDPAGALENTRRGIELYRRQGHATGAVRGGVLLAEALHDLGRRDEEAQVVAGLEPPADAVLAGAVAVLRARVARLAGDAETAAARLDEARRHLDGADPTDEVGLLLEAGHQQRGFPAERFLAAVARMAPPHRRHYEGLARAAGLLADATVTR